MECARSGVGMGLPAGSYAEAIREAAAAKTPEETLAAVIAMAVQTGPCDAASITMRGAGNTVETVAYSSDLILRADEVQYELGEGPCLDAAWTDGMFLIPDLSADDRWPRWARAAADLKVGSLVSVHLFTDTALGSLNLYSRSPRDYSHGEVEVAKIIAAHASVLLAYIREERNLRRAIDSRNLIGQAQGRLMQRYGLTAEKAFDVLRRYSQRQNVKLVVLAEQIATTGQLPKITPTRGHRSSDGCTNVRA